MTWLLWGNHFQSIRVESKHAAQATLGWMNTRMDEHEDGEGEDDTTDAREANKSVFSWFAPLPQIGANSSLGSKFRRSHLHAHLNPLASTKRVGGGGYPHCRTGGAQTWHKQRDGCKEGDKHKDGEEMSTR